MTAHARCSAIHSTSKSSFGLLSTVALARIELLRDQLTGTGFRHDQEALVRVDDRLDLRDFMTGKDEEAVRAGADVLVLLDRQRHTRVASLVHALADERAEASRRGEVLDPFVDLAKQALISRRAPALRLQLGRRVVAHRSHGARRLWISTALCGFSSRPLTLFLSTTTKHGDTLTRNRFARSARSVSSTRWTTNVSWLRRRCKIWAMKPSTRRAFPSCAS